MPGGIIDIVSYGSQDLFLTGTPQITFFKIVYRRYTNFAVENFDVPFDDPTGFGLSSSVVLKPIGDLVNKTLLKVEIPRISFKRIVSLEAIRKSTADVANALNAYQRCLIFMNANTNAYRAAMEVYSASNVIFSGEMTRNILTVFKSYILTPNNEDINWFCINSPLNGIIPERFNLLTIAKMYNDNCNLFNANFPDLPYNADTVPKDVFRVILDQAMAYSAQIQRYYDDFLRCAVAKNEDISNPNFKFAWVDRLGHAIIDYIDVYVGGEKIDRHYGIWLNVWYELTGKKKQSENYMKMIGNIPELTDFNRLEKPSYTLYIPLQFWFSRFTGLSLPLVALQYYDVTITVKLRDFQQCAYIEDVRLYDDVNFAEVVNLNDLFDNNKLDLNVTLSIDYVYLDSLERKKFAQSSHEYLIDQVQTQQMNDIENEEVPIQLDFYHPVRELIWLAQKKSFTENLTGFNKCRWDNYTWNKCNRGLGIKYSMLDFNGYSRFDKFDGIYFNYVQPYDHHSNTPSDGINVYSFALRPEEQQPTGSCNFTRITKAILTLWINPEMFINKSIDMTDECNLDPLLDEIMTPVNVWIFAINQNILRIVSGLGGVIYV